MSSVSVAAVVALCVWALVVTLHGRAMAKRIAARQGDSWAPCMKWGFVYGILLAVAMSAPPLWLWASGKRTTPGEFPVMLFLLLGLASGPALALFLQRQVTEITRANRQGQ